MASNYTGNPALATLTLSLMTGSDVKTAQQMRTICERLLDNAADVAGRVGPAANARPFVLSTLKLRRVALDGTSITDTAESCAAVQRAEGTPLIIMKTAQALVTSDADRFVEYGVPTVITSLVTAAASSDITDRIVVVGTGGNKCSFSDDDGATWTDGGDCTISGVGTRLVWSATASAGDSFWVGRPGSTAIYTRGSPSVDISWTPITGAVATGVQGMAVRTDGQVVVLDAANTVAFEVGPSGGFLPTGGTVANAASFVESGDLIGDGDDFIYHVGRRTGSATLQVSRSEDGVTWETIASLLPPGGGSFAGRPRIMMCQTTGLLVVVCAYSSGAMATYASVDGESWFGPLTIFPTVSTDAFAVAGGRLIYTHDAELFASDGIGY